MIRHIVLVRFSPDFPEDDRLTLLARVHDLRGEIPGLLDICAGASESPEQIERGFMHGFTVDFSDWAALQAYQDHPDHKAFGAALVGAALEGKEGILVFDLEVPEPHLETPETRPGPV